MMTITSIDYIATIIASAIAGGVIGMIVTGLAMYNARRDFDLTMEKEND